MWSGTVTGGNNVALGFDAGKVVSSGAGNVFIGKDAGDATQSGSKNVAVGHKTNTAHDTGNSITIGDTITGSDNEFRFGKASNVVSNTFTSNASWTRTSDVHKKTNIEDDTLGLDFINDLRTVTFNWKT